jgi:hypothetical protein
VRSGTHHVRTHKWEDNIKMDPRVMWCDRADWNQLGQDMEQWS